jgi:glyoxylase-like metal-dependent hydrolase (beta-lactamase superfamily II)
MTRLADGVFLFEDTCNVYVFVADRVAVLVDFGSGRVLEHLDEFGADRVAAVLMTHHHRDQGQGLPKAVAAGIPIWVPPPWTTTTTCGRTGSRCWSRCRWREPCRSTGRGGSAAPR